MFILSQDLWSHSLNLTYSSQRASSSPTYPSNRPFPPVMYAPCRGLVFLSLISPFFEVCMFPGFGQRWPLANVEIQQFGPNTFQRRPYFSSFVSSIALLSLLHEAILPTCIAPCAHVHTCERAHACVGALAF